MLLSFVAEQCAWTAPNALPTHHEPLQSVILNDPSQIQIPEYCHLKETHHSPGGKLIILLEDAHANLGAQKNLSRVMDNLMSRYDIPTVLVEGGDRDVTLDEIKPLADQKTWKIVANKFLNAGIITGAEYLNLTSDYPMRLLGIEYGDLYDQNLNAYAALADKRKEALDYLHRVQIAVDRLKNRHYPKALTDYENLPQDSLLPSLISLADQANISLERDFNEVFKFQQIHAREEQQKDIYQETFDKLNFSLLFQETDLLEDQVYGSLIKDADIIKIRVIDHHLHLLKKAYEIQMSSMQFQMFEANEFMYTGPQWIAFINHKLHELGYEESILKYQPILEEAKPLLKSFYDLVEQRDTAFMENTERLLSESGQNAAFMVIGGYHTAHVTELLGQENYSYVVLSPIIEHETDRKQYEEILLQSLPQRPLQKSKAYESHDTIVKKSFLLEERQWAIASELSKDYFDSSQLRSLAQKISAARLANSESNWGKKFNNWKEILKRAMQKYKNANTELEQIAALGKLHKSLHKYDFQIQKVYVDSQSLKPLDIAKAIFLNQTLDIENLRTVDSSSDGKSILIGKYNGEVQLFTYDEIAESFKEAPDWQYRHDDIVFSVRFSPDGKSILTGSDDKKVLLFTYDDHKQSFNSEPTWKYEHGDKVKAAEFSPDGKSILTGSDDGRARLFTYKKTIQSFTSEPVWEFDHQRMVETVRFSPDGKSILTGDFEGIARLFTYEEDAKSFGETPRWSYTHSDSVYAVQFSPDGQSILTGSYDGKVQLFDYHPAIKSFQYTPSWEYNNGKKAAFYSVDFSPDGESILTGSADKKARIFSYDKASDSFKKEPDWEYDHADAVLFAQFSSDGKSILTGTHQVKPQFSSDGGVINTNKGKLRIFKIETLLMEDQANAISLETQKSHPVSSLPSKVNKLIVPEVKPKKPLSWQDRLTQALQRYEKAQTEQERELAIDALRGILQQHEPEITTTPVDTKSLKPLDIAKAIFLTQTMNIEKNDFFQLSPDRKSIFAVSYDAIRIFSYDETTKRFKNTPSLIPTGYVIRDLEFLPDGKSILITENDHGIAQLFTYDENTQSFGDKPNWWYGHENGLRDTELSPDGKTILTISEDGGIQLFIYDDVNKSFPNHPNLEYQSKSNTKVSSAKFSPDGKSILVTGQDKAVKIFTYDQTNNSYKKQGWKHQNKGNSYSQFSPDGKSILITDESGTNQTVKTQLFTYNETNQSFNSEPSWENESGQMSYSAQFSPDGKSILTYGDNGKAELFTYNETTHSFNDKSSWKYKYAYKLDNVEFSPDGQYILIMTEYQSALFSYNQMTQSSYAKPIWKYKHNSSIESAQFSADGKSIFMNDHKSKLRILKIETFLIANQGEAISLETQKPHPISSLPSKVNKLIVPEVKPKKPSNWQDLLSQALQKYEKAQTVQAHNLALSNLNSILQQHESEIPTAFVDAKSFKPLEIAKARFLAQTLWEIKDESAFPYFSPDGKSILVAGSSKATLFTYDEVAQFFYEEPSWEQEVVADFSTPFSPDGRLILGVRDNNKIQLFSYNEATQSFNDGPVWEYEDKNYEYSDIKFSPDGKSILATSFHKEELGRGRVQLFTYNEALQAFDAKPILISEQKAEIDIAEFSPDGKSIMVGNSVGEVRLFIYNETTQLFEPSVWSTKHADSIASLQFSPDGKSILTASLDSQIRLFTYDAAAQSFKSEPSWQHGHEDAVFSAEFSHDGKSILTYGRSGKIKLFAYDETKGVFNDKPILEYQYKVPVYLAKFSPDSKSIIAISKEGDAVLFVYDDTTQSFEMMPFEGINADVKAAQFSSDGKSMLMVNHQGDLEIFKTEMMLATDTSSFMSIETKTLHSVDGLLLLPKVEKLLISPKAKAKKPSSWQDLLQQTLQNYEKANSEEEKKAAIDVLTQILQQHEYDLQATPVDSSFLKPMDIAKARFLTQTLSLHDHVHFVQFSADGKSVLMGNYMSLSSVQLFAYDEATQSFLSEPKWEYKTKKGSGIFTAQLSPDAKYIFISEENKMAKLFAYDENTQSFGQSTWKYEDPGGNEIVTAQFSPDGKSILTRNAEGMVRLFAYSEVTKAFETAWKPYMDTYTIVKFSPDGKSILTARENMIEMFHYDEVAGQFKDASDVVYKNEDTIHFFESSPDGKYILVAMDYGVTEVFTYDQTNSNSQSIFKIKYNTPIKSFQFSPDSRSFIITTHNRVELFAYDEATQTFSNNPSWEYMHGPEVHIAQFSPDGKSILTASDVVARLFFYNEITQKFNDKPDQEYAHGHTSSSIQFSPDAKFLFMGDGPGQIRILKNETVLMANQKDVVLLETQKIYPVSALPAKVNKLTVSSKVKNKQPANWQDSLKQAIQNCEKAKTEKELKVAIDVVTGILQQHKSEISTVSASYESLKPLDIAKATFFSQQVKIKKGVASLQFSPDGKSILVGNTNRLAQLFTYNETTKAFNRKPSWQRKHQDIVYVATFSPDGKSILTGTDGGLVQLFTYDEASQSFNDKPSWDYQDEHEGQIWTGQFSPNGKSILMGTAEGKVWIFAYDENSKSFNNQPVLAYEHNSSVSFVQFSPDGKSVLMGTAEGKIWIFAYDETMQSFNQKPVWEYAFESLISSAHFSSDGKSILIGSDDKTAQLFTYDATTQSFSNKADWKYEHESQVEAVHFSPDGQSILTGSRDGMTYVFDYDQTIHSFGDKPSWQHKGKYPIQFVQFSPDGKSILTGDKMRFRIYKKDTFLMIDPENGILLESKTKYPTSLLPSKVEKLVITGPAVDEVKDQTENFHSKLQNIFQTIILGPNTENIINELNIIDKPITSQAQVQQINWQGSLKDQLQKYEKAQTEEDKKAALEALAGILKQHENEIATVSMQSLFLEPLDIAKARFLSQILFFPSGASSVGFSADGKSILLANHAEGAVQLFTYDKFSQAFQPTATWQFQPQDKILTAQLSPDGKKIFISLENEKDQLFIYDEGTQSFGNKSVWPFDFNNQFKISFAQFSPDSKYMITIDKSLQINLFAYDETEKYFKFKWQPEHHIASTTAQFSPDSKAFLVASTNTVRLFTYDEAGASFRQTPNSIHKFGHSVYFVKFSPDGKYIFISTFDGATEIFTYEKNTKISDYSLWKYPYKEMNTAEFSPDGQSVLITGGNKASLFTFDEAAQSFSDKPIWEYDHVAKITSAHLSPDGKSIYMASKNMAWRFAYDEKIKTFSDEPDQQFGPGKGSSYTHFSPDGKHLLVGSSRDVIQIFTTETFLMINPNEVLSLETQKVHPALNLPNTVEKLEVDALTTIPPPASSEYVLAVLVDSKSLKPSDVIEARVLIQKFNAQNQPKAIQYSPNGKSILIGSDDGEVRLFTYDETSQSFNTTPAWTHKYNNEINSVQFSPDGKSILIAEKHSVWLFNYDETTKTFSHTPAWGYQHVAYAPAEFAEFSPDGKSILLWSLDDKLRLFNYNETTKSFSKAPDWKYGHTDPVIATKFLPDGSFLMGSHSGITHLSFKEGNTDELTIVERLKYKNTDILKIEFSPDAQFLFTVDGYHNTLLFSLNKDTGLYNTTPAFDYPYKDHNPTIQFSPDGKSILIGSDDGKSRLFTYNETTQAFSQTPVWEYQHHHPFGLVKFSPDGKSILTAEKNGDIRIFKIDVLVMDDQNNFVSFKTGKTYPASDLPPKVSKFIAYGGKAVAPQQPKSKSILSFDWQELLARAIKKYKKAKTSSEQETAKAEMSAILPNVPTISVDSKSLQPPAIVKARVLNQKFKIQNHARIIQYSPDGKYILTESDKTLHLFAYDQTTQSFDTTPIWTHEHDSAVGSVQFSPDSKSILVGEGRVAKLFTYNETTQFFNFNPDWEYKHESYLQVVQFSPDSKSILTGDYGKKIHRFTYDEITESFQADGDIQHQFKQPVSVIRFLSNGKSFIAADKEGKVWSFTYKAIDNDFDFKLIFKHENHPKIFRFSPDGKFMLTANNENGVMHLLAYDETTQSFNPKATWKYEYDGLIGDMQFSHDSKSILIGGLDKKVLLFTYNEISKSFDAAPAWGYNHEHSILNVEFSPDGKSILAGDLQGNIQIFKTEIFIMDDQNGFISLETSKIYSLSNFPSKVEQIVISSNKAQMEAELKAEFEAQTSKAPKPTTPPKFETATDQSHIALEWDPKKKDFTGVAYTLVSDKNKGTSDPMAQKIMQQFNKFEDANLAVISKLGKQNKTIADLNELVYAMEGMVRIYLELFKGISPDVSLSTIAESSSDYQGGKSIAEIFLRIKKQIEVQKEHHHPKAKASDLLSPEIEQMIQPFDAEKSANLIGKGAESYNPGEAKSITFAELINIVHQKGIRNLQSVIHNIKSGVNREVSVQAEQFQTPKNKTSKITLSYIDARTKSTEGIALPMQHLAMAFAKGTFLNNNLTLFPPQNALIISDEKRLAVGMRLGVHSARIQYSFMPVQEAGRVTVNYTDSGPSYAPGSNIRIAALAEAFRLAGFKVNHSGYHFDAYFDKDSGASSIDELPEKLEFAVQALSSTKDLDLDINKTHLKEVPDVSAKLIARIFLADGFLVRPSRGPNSTDDKTLSESIIQGKENIDRVLIAAKEVGIDVWPGVTGMRLIRKISEIQDLKNARRTESGPDASPIPWMIQKIMTGTQDELKHAKQIAVIAKILEKFSERQRIGVIGPYEIERLVTRVLGDQITFYILKDTDKGGYRIGYAVLGEFPHEHGRFDLFRRKELSNNQLNVQDLKEILEPQNMFDSKDPRFTNAVIQDFDPSTLTKSSRKHQSISSIAFGGVRINRGKILARVEINSAKKTPEQFDGKILVAEYTDTEDDPKFKYAKGTVVTTGSELSHAAVRSQGHAIPAMILNGAQVTDSLRIRGIFGDMEEHSVEVQGKTVYYYGASQSTEKEFEIKNGDLVYLDAESDQFYLIATTDDAESINSYEAYRALKGNSSSLSGKQIDQELRVILNGIQNSSLIKAILDDISNSKQFDGIDLAQILTSFSADQGHKEIASQFIQDNVMRQIDALHTFLVSYKRERKLTEDMAHVFIMTANLLQQYEALKANLKVINGRGKSIVDDDKLAEAMNGALKEARKWFNSKQKALIELAGKLDPKTYNSFISINRIFSEWELAGLSLETHYPGFARRFEEIKQSREQKVESLRNKPILMMEEIQDRMSRPIAGGKAANSAEILNALNVLKELELLEGEMEFTMPSGFVVNASEYQKWQESNKPDELRLYLQEAVFKAYRDLLIRQAEDLRTLIQQDQRTDDSVKNELLEILDTLNSLGEIQEVASLRIQVPITRKVMNKILEVGQNQNISQSLRNSLQVFGAVAVRSSGLEEDSKKTAMAGLKDTVLNAVGVDQLFAAIITVWNSGAEAVLIQEMINPKVSGVAFSADPVEMNSSEIRISSGHGLAKGIVDQIVKEPDTHLINKNSKNVRPIIRAKKEMVILDLQKGGVVTVPFEGNASQPALNEEQALAVGHAADMLSKFLAYEGDMEFSWVSDYRLVILQNRPITTIDESIKKGRDLLANPDFAFTFESGNGAHGARLAQMPLNLFERMGWKTMTIGPARRPTAVTLRLSKPKSRQLSAVSV